MVEFVRMDEAGRTYRRGFGGDTSNAAIAAARQGASVGYVTALGEDRFGDALMALWAEEGVDAAAVRRDQSARTGIYFVDPDPAGRNFTYFREGSAASRYDAARLPEEMLRAAKVLHFSGITLAISPSMRGAAMAAAGMAGGDVSLDTNLRLALWPVEAARTALMAAMAKARIVITSIDDCEALIGLDDADAIIDAFQAKGPEIVLVTMGAEGCLVAAGADRAHIPPHLADAVDSTGAGDSFAGSFHAWRLETGDPFEAARRAAIVAAGTVSGYGAIDPIPRRAAVLAALA